MYLNLIIEILLTHNKIIWSRSNNSKLYLLSHTLYQNVIL